MQKLTTNYLTHQSTSKRRRGKREREKKKLGDLLSITAAKIHQPLLQRAREREREKGKRAIYSASGECVKWSIMARNGRSLSRVRVSAAFFRFWSSATRALLKLVRNSASKERKKDGRGEHDARDVRLYNMYNAEVMRIVSIYLYFSGDRVEARFWSWIVYFVIFVVSSLSSLAGV